MGNYNWEFIEKIGKESPQLPSMQKKIGTKEKHPQIY